MNLWKTHLRIILEKIVNNTKKLNDSNKAIQSIKEFDRQGGGIFTESSYNFKDNPVYKKIENANDNYMRIIPAPRRFVREESFTNGRTSIRFGIDRPSTNFPKFLLICFFWVKDNSIQ